MKLDKGIVSGNEGETIGTVGSYVQQYKDIESGKRSTAKMPKTFKDLKSSSSDSLPDSWKPETEREILLHYCKRLGCSDYLDIENKSGQIASSINRLFGTDLTPSDTSTKIATLISLDDLAIDNFSNTKSAKVDSLKTEKIHRKFNTNLTEGNYSYVKDLQPLTEEQLDLIRFINPKEVVFSSNQSGFFLAVLPKNLKSFDKLFKFSPKEQLVFEMFQEQLGDSHKAKKLVLMSRLMNEADSATETKAPLVKKMTKKKTSKKKNS